MLVNSINISTIKSVVNIIVIYKNHPFFTQELLIVIQDQIFMMWQRRTISDISKEQNIVNEIL